MIQISLDAKNAILHLQPKSALAKEDFAQIARLVDPHIEASGNLAGIIIEFKSFPGWESLGAMAAHFKFVKEHHAKVKKIAAVTDAVFANVAEKLGSRFVAAEIKQFPYGQAEAARKWILGK